MDSSRCFNIMFHLKGRSRLAYIESEDSTLSAKASTVVPKEASFLRA